MGEAGALRVWFGAMLLTCIVCFGQVLVAQEKPNTVENRTYRIAPGDVLQIDVWKQSEITRTIPVLPDGTIYLPLVNGVKVAGLTAMQLAGLLREKLLPFVDNPQVTVTVVRMRGTPPTTLPARPILPQRAPQWIRRPRNAVWRRKSLRNLLRLACKSELFAQPIKHKTRHGVAIIVGHERMAVAPDAKRRQIDPGDGTACIL
jgi:hypothetical protein